MSTPAPIPERTFHPYITHDMIKEIPKGFRATLESLSKFEGHVPERSQFVFTGNGTALYSAMMGSQIMNLSNLEWCAAPAFELANYERGKKSSLLVAVSHSGITKSTLDAISKQKSFGASSIAVTHFSDRPISRVADETIVIGDSPDLSRCHTKAYTNSAAAVFALSLQFAQQNNGELETVGEEFKTKLGDQIESTVASTEESAKKIAHQMKDVSKILFAGAGPNSVTGREAALKIKEALYISGEGMELEEILHGPAMSFNKKTLVVVLAPTGPSVDRARDLIAASKKIGATVLVVSDLSNLESDYQFRIDRVHEYLSPFLAIIPLYFLAYYLAVENGKNPDYIHYTDQAYWDARSIIFPPGTH